jgi:multidrug efflux system membrane fusion protein
MRAPSPITGRLLATAALAALAGWLAGCHRGGGESERGARPAVPVVLGEVQRRDVPVELSAVGSVQAYVTVDVRPLVTGEIVGVFFSEGDEVQAGQKLFQIDPRPYEAALAQARGALARARQQARNARADARRYAELVRKEYVTRQQYDAALANAGGLDADVSAAEATVRKAALDLANCRIAAPIAGRTGAVLVQIGNAVQANQQAPLVVIARVRPVYVAFTVPEQNVEALRAGVGRMKVLASGSGLRPLEGTLTFVNNTVDPAAGTILAKATFPNEREELWPGRFVQVTVTTGVDRAAVVAPAAAVVSGQSGSFAYVVRGDDTVEQRPVEVARSDARQAVIAKGLQPGERVVIDGQLSLVPNARVAARPAAQPQRSAPGQQPPARTQARRP